MNNLVIQENQDGNSFLTIEGGFSELTPAMIRGSISQLQDAMIALPPEQKLALETMHNFADGTYVRTVFMKAGSLIVGKIHKLEHIVVIGKGSASVVSEEFGSKIISAPMIFVSPPFVKRLLFIHEDMVWTTVHKNPTNSRDLDLLEKELIVPDYDVEIKNEGEVK